MSLLVEIPLVMKTLASVNPLFQHTTSADNDRLELESIARMVLNDAANSSRQQQGGQSQSSPQRRVVDQKKAGGAGGGGPPPPLGPGGRPAPPMIVTQPQGAVPVVRPGGGGGGGGEVSATSGRAGPAVDGAVPRESGVGAVSGGALNPTTTTAATTSTTTTTTTAAAAAAVPTTTSTTTTATTTTSAAATAAAVGSGAPSVSNTTAAPSPQPTCSLTFLPPTGPPRPRPRTSALQSIIITRLENPELKNLPAGKTVDVRVWLSCLSGTARRTPVALSLSNMASIGQLVRCTVVQYKLDGRQPPLKDNFLYYQLRLTDDEIGTPDTDLPALERGQLLKAVCCADFALCDNPRATEEIAAEPRGASSVAAAIASAAASAPKAILVSGDGKLTLKIALPSGEVFKMSAPADQLLRDVSVQIAMRQNIPFEAIKLSVGDSQKALENNITLRSLPTLDLVCSWTKPKIRSGVDDDARSRASSTVSSNGHEVDLNYIMSEFSAIKYKEYTVVKTNKLGRKQERIMGIDDQCIYNTVPESGRGFLAKKAKRAFRHMNEVESVALKERESADFTIVYKDGQIAKYTALTYDDAAEICAKIKFLLNMLKPSPSVASSPSERRMSINFSSRPSTPVASTSGAP